MACTATRETSPIGAGGESREDDHTVKDDLNAVIPASSSYVIRFQDNDDPSTFHAFVRCTDSARPFK